MSAADFLTWPGDGTGRRFQLIDWEMRPMSPASRIHAVIQANLAFLLVGAIRASGARLQVLTEAAVIPGPNASGNVRVPDLVVAPDDDRRGEQTVLEPLLLAEVLSPGNSDDTRDNVRVYATLPTVQEMAIFHTTRIMAEIHRRDGSGLWQTEAAVIGPGARLSLPSVGLECVLDEVYARTWLTRGD